LSRIVARRVGSVRIAGATAMPLRDWRSPAAYADLWSEPQPTLAWEHLRRHPAYQQEYDEAMRLDTVEAQHALALRWGLRSPSGSER
jgi:hypothetical protein